MKANRIVFIVFIVLIFSSCRLSYKILLGVDTKPEWYSQNDILKSAKKYEINSTQLLILDTASYFDKIKTDFNERMSKITINDSVTIQLEERVFKDDYQPAQFRLFDKQGKELFKLVNCYVDPPIPMNWNVQNCFDSFPFKTNYKSLAIHHFDLAYILENTHNLKNESVTLDHLPQSDYYAIIFWNDVLKRPSKKLIKLTRKKIAKLNKDIHVLYINNHNAFIWNSIDDKTKKELKNQNFE